MLSQFAFSRLHSLLALALGFFIGMGTLVLAASAQEGRIVSFDVPGADTNPADGTGTYPAGINAWGAIIGTYQDANTVYHGFVRSPGGRFTTVDAPGADTTAGSYNGTLANAINDNTAMIYTTDLGEKLQRVVAIAKQHKIPMLLDDAAGIPPADNARLYARMEIDLYCFSGGKGLCGPQCSGLLLGRKDLIESALLNSSPREGAVCRPMKVGKEEVIGCLTALETWLKLDEKKLYDEWNGRVDRIRKLVETVPGVTTDTYVPDDGNRYPTLKISWDQQAWRYSIADCVEELRAGDPVIEALGADNPSLVKTVREGQPNRKERKGPDHIELVSMTIKPGEEIIVGQRLRTILGAAQKKSAA